MIVINRGREARALIKKAFTYYLMPLVTELIICATLRENNRKGTWNTIINLKMYFCITHPSRLMNLQNFFRFSSEVSSLFKERSWLMKVWITSYSSNGKNLLLHLDGS